MSQLYYNEITFSTYIPKRFFLRAIFLLIIFYRVFETTTFKQNVFLLSMEIYCSDSRGQNNFCLFRKPAEFRQEDRSSILCDLDKVYRRSVSQSRKGRIFPPSSMGSRKLAIDVFLPRRTT